MGKPPGDAGPLGTVAGSWVLSQPALGVVTHLGFQFCDLQVQFIQVFVHKSDESASVRKAQGLEMETLAPEAALTPL